MITIDDVKENKKNYVLPTIVVIIASIIIIAIIVVYYWTLTESFPQPIKDYFVPKVMQVVALPKVDNVDKQKVIKPVSQESKTKIIKYVFSANLPQEIKEGVCISASIAQPYRNNAFRCQVENSIYDPCFANLTNDKVVCQMNPLNSDIFMINLSEPLPENKLPEDIKNNWAWFLELEDGTICSPYTGTKPLINNEIAIYGCKAKVKGDLDVLIGDLIIGDIWTAKRMIVVRDNVGTGWDTKFLEVVNIKSIWQ